MPRPKKEKAPDPVEEIAAAHDAKLEARNASKNKQAGAGSSFDVFDDDDDLERELMAKAGLADGLKSAADIARAYLPLPHMALEWVIGRRGIPIKTVNEFIGEENTGKSSLMYRLMGTFIQNSIPCYYINTEPKELETEWIARLTGSNDPATAKKIAKAIKVDGLTSTLDEMDEKVRTWAHIKRYELGKKCVPFDIPLVIIVDSLSKLMNPAEATVLCGSDSKSAGKKAEMMKGVADISQQPGVTAKWQHVWMRIIAPFCDKYNVTIIVTSGQNSKMDSTGSSKFATDGGKSLNKTKTGGNATNQSSGLQATVTQCGMAKKGTNTIGRLVRLRVVKSSFGPVFRDIIYTIQAERFTDDADNYISQAIDMDEAFANVLVENKVFGLSVLKKRYTSMELGLNQVTAEELCRLIHSNDELRYKVGSALKISGYEAINPLFA